MGLRRVRWALWRVNGEPIERCLGVAMASSLSKRHKADNSLVAERNQELRVQVD